MKRAALALIIAISAAGCSAGSKTGASSNDVAASAAPKQTVAAAGASVYQTNCSSCHGADGAGSPGAFPPLAHNAFVTGPAGPVLHVVKNGLTGAIAVGTQHYNGQMPAWHGTLSNEQIAAVVSHIRTSWGNQASTVSAAQVAAAK